MTRILIRVPKLNEKIFKIEAYLLSFQKVVTVLGVFSTSLKVNVSAIMYVNFKMLYFRN